MNKTTVDTQDEAEKTKSARTRASILVAAVKCFGNSGFRSTSVAEICREAGVSGSLAYAYFKDKEDLFTASINYDAAEVIQEGIGHVQNASTLHWQTDAFGKLIDSVAEHPLTRRVLAGQEPQATAELIDLKALEYLRNAVAERIQLGQDTGVVRDDINVKDAARAGVHLWIVLLMAAQQFGTEFVETEFPVINAVFQKGVLKDVEG